MGSGVETVRETIDYLNGRGAKLGVVQVHLFRPFSVSHLLDAVPRTVKAIAVLDRTQGARRVRRAPLSGRGHGICRGDDHRRPPAMPRIVGGRYGLASKEFTPAMVKAVFDNLASASPKNHFTIGIKTTSRTPASSTTAGFITEADDVVGCIFYGLGADGTVGANKNSIKIIGEQTPGYAQGFFVYDSKKSGSRTTSHLRFGPQPIRSTYLVQRAQFIACHQFQFVERIDMLDEAADGAVFLLNSPFGPAEVWDELPRTMQADLIRKHIRLYVIDADRVAIEAGMPGRINTIMQTCFFAISGVLPRDEAIARIKDAIQATYARKGKELVESNFAAVDRTLENLHEVALPAAATSTREPTTARACARARFRQTGHGHDDGRARRRAASQRTPGGRDLPDRPRRVGKSATSRTSCPSGSRSSASSAATARWCARTRRSARATTTIRGWRTRPKVSRPRRSPAVGSRICASRCRWPSRTAPAASSASRRARRGVPKRPASAPSTWRRRRRSSSANGGTSSSSTRCPTTSPRAWTRRWSAACSTLTPLFEFSGACAGCGETPYLRLLTQLFGDRLLVANATGCSSIYGGNLPTTPWSVNKQGRGPAWANSLFEDNAEFGLGFRLSLDKQREQAEELLARSRRSSATARVRDVLDARQVTQDEVDAQRRSRRRRSSSCSQSHGRSDSPAAAHAHEAPGAQERLDCRRRRLGLRHRLRRTGSRAGVGPQRQHPRTRHRGVFEHRRTGVEVDAARRRGEVRGRRKAVRKKDLGLMAVAYGNVYVAQIAMGASAQQTVDAFLEAEAHDGPSLIIAYSHCIAHGINMRFGMRQQKLAVECGHWPLYRYKPAGAGPRAGRSSCSIRRRRRSR